LSFILIIIFYSTLANKIIKKVENNDLSIQLKHNEKVENIPPPLPDTVVNNNNGLHSSPQMNNSQPSLYNYNVTIKKEPQQIYSDTIRSVLTVVGGSGYDMSLGSGFFVKDGIIVTNEHVVRGNDVFVSRIIGKKDFLQYTNLRCFNKNIDIAFLSVPSGSASPLQLGDDSIIKVGDTVYAIGNPEGYEGTFSVGIISALHKNDDNSNDEIQITAPISSGSSGGPLLDVNGKVIGIVYRGNTQGQNINLAIPVSKLKKYMYECGIN
jgi:serine protease Do